MLVRRSRDHLSLLAGCPPFDGWTLRALRPIEPHVDRLRPAEGTVLARQGWTVREVVVVLTGEVHGCDDDGRITRYGPGETVGGAELLGGATHPVTLVAGRDLDVLVVYGPAYRWAARGSTRSVGQ